MLANERCERCARVVVLCDLDGVVWLAHQPIPGSVDAIATLRAAGHRVLFVTNNSAARVEAQEAALGDIGIPAAGDVLTSAKAAALLIEPGERVMVCGGEGVTQAVEGTGRQVVRATTTRTLPTSTSSWSASIARSTTKRCCRANRAVALGARLIGTNDDATYPTPDGPIPGGGAILASIVTASGVPPIVAGKPHRPMAALIRATVGERRQRERVMVGDRPETDGLMAATSAVATPTSSRVSRHAGHNGIPAPDMTARDLAGVSTVLLAEGAAYR